MGQLQVNSGLFSNNILKSKTTKINVTKQLLVEYDKYFIRKKSYKSNNNKSYTSQNINNISNKSLCCN